jgi:hypothetical protein
MKRSIIIVVAAALLISATVRLLLKTEDEFEGERQSYVRSLNYNFSSKVDSIIVVSRKNGRGFLVCELTNGKLTRVLEDSLNQNLENHEWMRFLVFNPEGHAQIFLEDIFNYHVGDSVCVNSSTDKFDVYRNEKPIFESSVSRATMYKVSWASWLKNN